MKNPYTDESPQFKPLSGLAGVRMTDEELLVEYRTTGDETIFAELVGRYERELYNYLRRFLGDAAMAEDVFQSTFLQVHLKCEQFEPGRAVRPWLYTIATNQAIDSQRRNRRHRLVSLNQTNRSGKNELGTLLELVENRDVDPSVRLEDQEQHRWVQQAVGDLPDPLRSTVLLVYFQGLKYREAAEVLSIPVGTVKSRMHTAILKLNEAWKLSRGASET
jgi:RNA polymerase sigma-70 factor (ECF subfamily)